MPEKEAGAREQTEGAPEEEKIEKYKEMLGGSRAIFVMSMSAKEKNIGREKQHRPTAYSDIDIRGFMGGGHAIVSATAEISQYFPEVKIVTTVGDEGEDKPTIARIYADKLERLGVPEERIELEEKSTNTLTELFELVKLSKRYDWEDVSIITNENHIKRVQAMLDYLEDLAKRIGLEDEEFFEAWDHFEKGKKLQVHLLPAEDILILKDSRYQEIIEEVRASALYKKRVEAEDKGIEQIKNGTYGKKK